MSRGLNWTEDDLKAVLSKSAPPPVKRAKYGNKREKIDGYTFDSLLEARRYQELKLMEKAGEIRDLTVHPPFSIQVNGIHCGKTEMDFLYFTKEGKRVVEDTKGVSTPLSKLQHKLLFALYSIQVKVIR